MPPNNLTQSLIYYKGALKSIQDVHSLPNPKDVFGILVARDKIHVQVTDKTKGISKALLELIELDDELKKQTGRITQAVNLANWRVSIAPPETSWWWYLDEHLLKQKKREDTLRGILVGTLLALALPLALEIIQRFWKGAPDIISIWGTLLTLLLATSPLVKQGREVTQWALEQIAPTRPKQYANIMVGMSILTLVILLVARLWLLPGPLATYYNNEGTKARASGNLTLARQMFQRAAALNPDQAVPYHNIATAYQDIGFDAKSIEWYEKAIEQDAGFAPAYRGLGELNNKKGEYEKAETILLAGLSIDSGYAEQATEQITQYELLSNLGWSYWGQNKLDLAQTTLESALSMEISLKDLGDLRGVEYRLALLHFYLAQIYEQTGEMDLAQQQWEECLRFLDQADWRQRERYLIAQQHLQALTK